MNKDIINLSSIDNEKITSIFYKDVLRELNERNINVNDIQNKYYQHNCSCLLDTSYKIIELKFIQQITHYFSKNDYETYYSIPQLIEDLYSDGSGYIRFELYTKNETLTTKEKALLKDRLYEYILNLDIKKKIKERRKKMNYELDFIETQNKSKFFTFFKDNIRKEKISKIIKK